MSEPTSAPYPDLPLDIARSIFENLALNHKMSDCLPLLRVSKIVREWTIPIIFRAVHFGHGHHIHLRDFAYTINRDLSAAPHIRSLGIEVSNWDDISQIAISRFTSLTKLGLRVIKTPSDPPSEFWKQITAHKITHLSVSSIQIDQIQYLPKTITHFHTRYIQAIAASTSFWETLFSSLRAVTHVMIKLLADNDAVFSWRMLRVQGIADTMIRMLAAAPTTLEVVVGALCVGTHWQEEEELMEEVTVHEVVKATLARVADERVVFVGLHPAFGTTEGLVSYAAPRKLFMDWDQDLWRTDELDTWEMADLCLRKRAGRDNVQTSQTLE